MTRLAIPLMLATAALAAAGTGVSVQVLGAARRVTGSCHLIRTPKATILIDLGMAQGDRESDGLNARKFQFTPEEIDLVVVTHAHIDHMGLLPRFVREGYRGPVLSTPTTKGIMAISLKDSAKLQWMEASRKVGLPHVRAYGRNQATPEQRAKILAEALYGFEHVDDTMKLVRTAPYGEAYTQLPGVRIRFFDAGHLPGSAAVEVQVETPAGPRTLVFGGDTGNDPYPLLRSPQPLEQADLVLLESTYGHQVRDKVDLEERYGRFVNTIQEALADGGHVLMPAFAVGRSHVILSWLARMKAEGKLPVEQPIVLDSPMAEDSLKAIREEPGCLDPEKTGHLVDERGRFFWVPGLKLGLHRDEELLPNSIVIASSGMLTGGRMIGHVQKHAGDPRNDLVFTGHSGPGSPARKIIDGATKVRIGGQEVEIRARVRRLSGFSGHGDQRQMIEYVKAFAKAPGKVVLVHGEPEAGEALQAAMQQATGIPTEFPARGTVYEIE